MIALQTRTDLLRTWQLASLVALLLMPGLALGADCNGNGVDDAEDLATGLSEDCNGNDLPDECEGLPVELSLGSEVLGVAALPRIVASLDVDRDGDLDLISGSRNAGTSIVTVLVGDGDRGFAPAHESALDGLAFSMAVDDLDGDGFFDVATANGDFLLVLRGEAGGTFAEPVRYDHPFKTRFVTTGDVTGDGAPDLIVENRNQNTISIRAGTGDGTFGEPRDVEVGDRPRAIITGNLDRDPDGRIDIATLNQPSEDSSVIAVLLNTGGGFFTPAVHYPAGGRLPFGLKVADVNGDDALDLVAASSTGISVLLARGDGTFKDAVDYPSVGAKAFELGDFNGDHLTDLAITLQTGNVVVRVNDGAGGFQVSILADRLGSVLSDVAAGDYDRDGRTDLALTTLHPSAIQFLWNGESPALSFEAETVPIRCRNANTSGCEPHAGVLADFDNDGLLDVVGAIPRPGLLSLALNSGGHLRWVRDLSYGASFPLSAEGGELDGNENMDLVSADNNRNTLWVHVGRGNGTFSNRSYPVGVNPFAVTLADFDGDGDLDAATANQSGTVSVLFNSGRATFGGRRDYARLGEPRGIKGVDLNGDGHVDLAVTDSIAVRVLILWNQGDGTFEVGEKSYELAAIANFIDAGDLDHDGDQDLVTVNPAPSTSSVLINAGDGTFLAPVDYSTGHGAFSGRTVDIDGDGHLDLLTASENKSSVSILLGVGDGEFLPPQIFPTGEAPRFALPGDVDGDGDLDIVSIDRGGRTFTTLYNTSARSVDLDYLSSICTPADFQRLSRIASAASAAERFVKFTLPVSAEAALESTVYQNTAKFALHEDFLRQSFPERLGTLDRGLWVSLVERRATRQYFAGSVSRIPTDRGLIYGVSIIADWRDDEERLSPEEVSGILEKLRSSFRLEPVMYFPNSRDAVEVAEDWDDPGFEMYFDTGGPLSYEPYTTGVGYGFVRLMDEDTFDAANESGQFSFKDILVLDFAPRDIEGIVSGVITADPQGELSHLSIRTNRRGTPNAFVRNGLDAYGSMEGKLVRLEVTLTGAIMIEARPADAEEFWESNRPSLSVLPQLDPEFGELSSFEEINAMDAAGGDLPVEARFGGKASNLARLQTILDTPELEQYRERGFAVPVRYYLEFMEANRMESALRSGIEVSYNEYLEELFAHDKFQADPGFRFEKLATLRQHMRSESVVDPELVERLSRRIPEIYNTTTSRVRFRSSSNVEDAVEFNGAGLYDSLSVCVEDDLDGDDTGPSHCDPEREDERGIARGLRRVWASLWNFRAFEERAFYGIPQELAAMGVLSNRAFVDELANGVAFTGNPTNAFDRRYVVTVQKGEESVVSPEPGVLAEKDVLELNDVGEVVTIDREIRSTLVEAGEVILTDDQLEELGDLLWHIDQHFPVDTGNHRRDELLLDVEFKIEPTSELAVKQVRSFLLSDPGPPPPTFELVIPPGTLACGMFNIARDAREEYELKSTVALKAGTVALEAGARSFSIDIVEELVVGPDQQVATSSGPGRFSFSRVPAERDELIYRFKYTQEFGLPGGERVIFEISQLDFRTRDGEVVVGVRELTDAELTDGVVLQSTLERLGDGGQLDRISYTSCGHPNLPRWDVTAQLSNDSSVLIEERYREVFDRDFGPASLAWAEVTLSGQRRLVTDYWNLVYSAVRHNKNVVYWIVLDPPATVDGVDGPVHVVELRAPIPAQELAASASLLGSRFELLKRFDDVSFDKQPSAVKPEDRFVRGDCNSDGGVSVSDCIFSLRTLFSGGDAPGCTEACNTNGDTAHDVTDVVFLLDYLFKRGRPPAAPFPRCGLPPRAELDCRRATCE